MTGFRRATKKESRLRMTIDGPSGSGKTFTALTFAFALGDKVAVIDTERGSASKYADVFPAFDVLELETFSPALYVEGIKAAEAAGYDVLVIDSLSHAWEGVEGALDLVDKAKARSRTGNSFTAWRDVTPMHREMVDAILRSRCHIISTMRVKTEYVMEQDDKGRVTPRKIGLAPVQRAGMEYEFDIVGEMDWDHHLSISKSRCTAVDQTVTLKPGAAWMRPVLAWLSGEKVSEPEPPTFAPVDNAELKPEPKPSKWSRPMAPETVKEAITIKASKNTSPASQPQKGLCAGSIEALFPLVDKDVARKMRYSLMTYLVGTDSTQNLTSGQASALIDWASTGDGHTAHPDAVQEAAAIITMLEREAGQQGLL